MIATLIALVVSVLLIALIKARAKHHHRPAGTGRRRRRYQPARGSSCPFRYARADRDASRRARFVVITHNDRLENRIQEARRAIHAA